MVIVPVNVLESDISRVLLGARGLSISNLAISVLCKVPLLYSYFLP